MTKFKNVEPFNFHKVINGYFFILLNIMIICVLWFELFSQVSDVAYGPLVTIYSTTLII